MATLQEVNKKAGSSQKVSFVFTRKLKRQFYCKYFYLKKDLNKNNSKYTFWVPPTFLLTSFRFCQGKEDARRGKYNLKYKSTKKPFNNPSGGQVLKTWKNIMGESKMYTATKKMFETFKMMIDPSYPEKIDEDRAKIKIPESEKQFKEPTYCNCCGDTINDSCLTFDKYHGLCLECRKI